MLYPFDNKGAPAAHSEDFESPGSIGLDPDAGESAAIP
jgi:hypothetical protein